ncbi:MAG: hypothetical protein LBU42_00100 [Prevotellaceae bacterium]|jgi:hypothetical protein|nr:hypothetical protein [Prevotellaceae bacterium]
MRTPDYIPQGDYSFLEWATTLLHVLGQSLERFGVPAEVYERLGLLRDDYFRQFEKANTPGTRTAISVLNKNKARDALKTAVRQAVREYLAYNHAVEDPDRKELGLRVPKTSRTPAPVAATYPAGWVDTGMIRCITIHFADQHTSESVTRAKPPGQHGVEIRWVMLDTPPVNLSELTHSAFDTCSPFTLEFKEYERGKTVYFALCWENTRGKKGPWSPMYKAVIP